MNKALQPYLSVAELIARTFPHAEVVLHDMQMPQHSVVYVANSFVTGRKVGQTFHHLIEKAVFAGNPDDGVVDNFFFDHDGKRIRSSSLLIRNDKKELIGALCINIDTSEAEKVLEVLNAWVNGPEGDRVSAQKQTVENAGTENKTPVENKDSVSQFVNSMIDSMVNELVSAGSHTREDRLQLIRFMDERGVFLVKGSLEYVAGKLGLSKVTLYGYLDQIHGKR